MNLMQDAKKLIEEITSDANGFSTSITLTSPTGEVAEITGLYSDHTLMYDENGQPINGKKAHVTISEQHLIDLNYPTRDSRGFISLKGHQVLINYADGSTKLYISDDHTPDYTINLILLFLSEYAN